ncbi:MAG TPA: glutamate-cysteine ligase family protein, partial [Acidimicrobiales bacterium]|nr:glutamate-cysteine ligase family protein [Acidimicrobiales bacterium]
LELSSLPFVSVERARALTAADLAVAAEAAARAGVRLVGLGADPQRQPRRVVDSPRYAAMEAYFDAGGPAGRRMMCNTAAVQVNVGLGPSAADADRQWRVASAIGPTLGAAFANSPLLGGRPSCFRSSRLASWWAMDPTRTRPVEGSGAGPDAWAEYVLDARVMLIRAASEQFVVPPGRAPTFREWITSGHPLGWPALEDLDYHASTLFPPVRPKGWLELRMVDAQPDPWWQVPLAVAAGLLLDPDAGEEARRAAVAAGVTDAGLDAARVGLAAPPLAASARACFAAATAGLRRLGVASAVLEGVAAYAERWVDRGRTPADDVLDAWSREDTPRPAAAGVRSWT